MGGGKKRFVRRCGAATVSCRYLLLVSEIKEEQAKQLRSLCFKKQKACLGRVRHNKKSKLNIFFPQPPTVKKKQSVRRGPQ